MAERERQDVYEAENERRQHLALALVTSQAWQEIGMLHVLEQVGAQEQIAGQIRQPQAVRLAALDRRQALLEFVARIYLQAQVPNPFQSARGALYATLAPRPVPSGGSSSEEGLSIGSNTGPRHARSTGGSVA